jgi:hypothetical protein
VVLCLLATTLVTASPALAANGGGSMLKQSASSLLFVQETPAGDLAQVKPGVYRLVFRGVSPTVATFTDRPRRRAGEQGLPHFVHGWAADGFAADPPNAALVLHGAPSSHDVAMLTISHPRYDRRTQRLAYTAKPLHGPGDKSLAGFSHRGDPLRPLAFDDASLFIDNAGSDAAIVPLNLTITIDQPEPQETVLQISPDSSALWSLGRPGSRASGLQLTSPNGPLPFSRFVLSPTELAFRTGSEASGPTTFSLTLYAESETSTGVLELLANIAPGVQIDVAVGGVVSAISSGLVVLPLE